MAGVRLEFAQFGHFDFFNIYRNLASTTIESLGQPLGISSTMYYEDLTVEPNRDYYYRVGVTRDSAEEFSEEFHVKTLVEFDPPYDLVVEFKNDETNRLELNWKVDGFVDEQRYYCSETPLDFENLPTPKAVLAGDVREYVDTTIEMNKTYYVCVSSVKNGVEKLSSEIEVKPTNDQFWNNVTALFHFDESFVDEKGNTVTNTGAKISTDDPKFGSGCGYFSGSNYGLNMPTSVFSPQLQDFTVEFWCKPTSYGRTYDMAVVGYGAASGQGLSLHLNRTNGAPSWWDGASYFGSGKALTINTWNHVVFYRKVNEIGCFVNGIKHVFSITYSKQLVATSNIKIARSYDSSLNNYFVGYLDELRITVGVCRYTENFVPETKLHRAD